MRQQQIFEPLKTSRDTHLVESPRTYSIENGKWEGTQLKLDEKKIEEKHRNNNKRNKRLV